MATDSSKMTYPPLSTLKTVAEGLWIVDGPIIFFGMPWPKMPFSTRATIIRLSSGLFIHSPTPLTATLKNEVDKLGPVKWIIGPNRIHYAWIPDWQTAYPEAMVYLAPKIVQQARGKITFSHETLDAASGYPWDAELATLPILSRFMTEVEFFHRPTRTLILTDLIENFESDKLGFWMRQLARVGGVLAPHGSTPRDIRTTFQGHRKELQAAVQTMIEWHPERIILAHGRCYESDGTAELKRALHWALF